MPLTTTIAGTVPAACTFALPISRAASVTDEDDRSRFRDRAKRYRKLAQDAAQAAALAESDDSRRSFILIAAGWQELADSWDARAEE